MQIAPRKWQRPMKSPRKCMLVGADVQAVRLRLEARNMHAAPIHLFQAKTCYYHMYSSVITAVVYS